MSRIGKRTGTPHVFEEAVAKLSTPRIKRFYSELEKLRPLDTELRKLRNLLEYEIEQRKAKP